jgi:hypothetical protein
MLTAIGDGCLRPTDGVEVEVAVEEEGTVAARAAPACSAAGGRRRPLRGRSWSAAARRSGGLVGGSATADLDVTDGG